MALTEASLSGKIKTELEVVFGVAADAAQLQKFADAIAKAVIDEFTSNAVVNVTGVTAGPASVTGTIS